ncbi:hypothetical protein ES707_20713 [subsurface metagenome]
MLMIKGLFRGVFQIALFAALLFIPAGTWHWSRAIQFLVVYGLLLLVSIIVLARLAPSSLEARLLPLAAKSQPMADRVITSLFLLSLFYKNPRNQENENEWQHEYLAIGVHHPQVQHDSYRHRTS